MAFRLPRLPRGEALVDKFGKPLLALQRWWQSVVESLEGVEEAIEDLEVYAPAQRIADVPDALPPPVMAPEAANDLMPPVLSRECDGGLMEPPLGALMANAGTVLSVDASGGTTGLTFSGGPITRSGTLTLAGTLVAANGGTGVTALGDITRVNDTNVTLTLGGTPTGAVITSTSFTLGWSGQLAVGRGGTGAATLTGIVVGNGTSAFTTITPGTGVTTALAVNVGSAGAFITFNGALGTPSSGTLTNCTGLPVAGITSSTTTALGVGSLELGHATDTTLARSSAGNVTIEGNLIYRAGGTDVPVTDGGTGASTAAAARTNLAAAGTGVVNTFTDRQVFSGGSYSAPAAGAGMVYSSAVDGLLFGGNGSTNDLYFLNDAGNDVIVVPTGTRDITVGGTVTCGSNTTASAANLHQAASGSVILRSTSSARYKTAVRDITDEEANRALSLRPVAYRSTAEVDDGRKLHFGLIAEEVAESVPQLVHYAFQDDQMDEIVTARPSGAKLIRRQPKAGESMRPDGVQYERLCVLLLGVVKRQEARIAKLEAALPT